LNSIEPTTIAILSPHPRSGWAQKALSKGAGISNIEYRLHEFRSDGSQLGEQKKIEHSDTALQYSTFLVRYSLFSFIFTGSVEHFRVLHLRWRY